MRRRQWLTRLHPNRFSLARSRLILRWRVRSTASRPNSARPRLKQELPDPLWELMAAMAPIAKFMAKWVSQSAPAAIAPPTALQSCPWGIRAQRRFPSKPIAAIIAGDAVERLLSALAALLIEQATCSRLADPPISSNRPPMVGTKNPRILVDADACPVKDEIYRVAWRREVPVAIVSNSYLRLPDHPLVERVVVSGDFDAADDWIAEAANAQSVVITADILLADRCLKAGATVIAPNGKPFTTSSIGAAIATRAIMADLRAGGDQLGGPAPFTKTDRSRFLSALDEALVRMARH